MNEENEKLTNEEMLDMEDMAEFIKKLTPKEKERVLYMLQGAVMISEAMNVRMATAL